MKICGNMKRNNSNTIKWKKFKCIFTIRKRKMNVTLNETSATFYTLSPLMSKQNSANMLACSDVVVYVVHSAFLYITGLFHKTIASHTIKCIQGKKEAKKKKYREIYKIYQNAEDKTACT